MNVTTWQERARAISPRSAREFYDSTLAETHVFLFETAHLELPPHGGGFSLKLALSGEEEYFIGRRTVCVQPGDMLLMNAGETYGSRIRQPTRSLSLFFPAADVLAASRVAASPDGDLEPIGSRPCPTRRGPSDEAQVHVPQIRFKASRENRQNLGALLRSLDGASGDAVDEPANEAAIEAARVLLLSSLAQAREVVPGTLTGVRKRSTRDELLSRLLRALEYVEDVQGEGCSLDRLAAIACLSRFHFLRLFKEAFGSGPAAYARRRRLRRVADALARGEPEDQVAARAGYADRFVLRRALRSAGLGGVRR